MDSNIDESITKIYEKQQTVSGSEEEAMQYLTILKRHPELNVTFEENESNIKLPLKSWNKIIKKIPEEESYSLTYICFSLINEVDENEIWGIKKTKESDEAEVFQDVFFNTVLEASIPHEIPFAMCEEDFSQFTDYFNQKEANERNIKLSNEDWINKEKENEKPLDKQDTEINKDKDLDEDKNVKEVKKQIIEDKNGVKKLITTKTVTQSQTIYKRKIQPQPQTKIQKDKEKEKDKVISIPSKPEQKVELIKKQDVIPKKEEKIKVPEQKVEQIKQQEVVPKKEEKIIIPEKEEIEEEINTNSNKIEENKIIIDEENDNKEEIKGQNENENLQDITINTEFNEIIYFNHFYLAQRQMDFKPKISGDVIPYMMSRDYLYSLFEDKRNYKNATNETYSQILGRVKQFMNSNDDNFNKIFLDHLTYYWEVLGKENSESILIPVLSKIVEDKINTRIYFLKILK